MDPRKKRTVTILIPSIIVAVVICAYSMNASGYPSWITVVSCSVAFLVGMGVVLFQLWMMK